MITTERLEELIKQGETVYIGDTTHIKLSIRDCVKYDKYDNAYYLVHRGMWFGLSVIYETEDRAEWHCKMTAERTERFEPPMWEDIENEYKFFFIHNEDYYCFYVNKNHNEIDLVRNEFYYELGDGDDEATKENYIKACEIVRDLFNKGGAK